MLGFTEKEVGHLTFKKWFMLFQEYQKYHNFKINGGVFKIVEKIEKNPNGWIPF